MYSDGPLHMAEQKQGDQLEPTYNSSVRMRDVALRTCQKRLTIGRNCERESGISALMAQQDEMMMMVNFSSIHSLQYLFPTPLYLLHLFTIAHFNIGSIPNYIYMCIYIYIYIYIYILPRLLLGRLAFVPDGISISGRFEAERPPTSAGLPSGGRVATFVPYV